LNLLELPGNPREIASLTYEPGKIFTLTQASDLDRPFSWRTPFFVFYFKYAEVATLFFWIRIFFKNIRVPRIPENIFHAFSSAFLPCAGFKRVTLPSIRLDSKTNSIFAPGFW
jgi:hypothetical protein